MTIAAIAVAGAAGALARYGVGILATRWVAAGAVGTFAVNVLGCFLIGVTVAWTEPRVDVSPALRAAIVTGFLGAFTTFSAFGLDTWSMVRAGSWAQATLYVMGTVVFGLGAVWAGHGAGSRL